MVKDDRIDGLNNMKFYIKVKYKRIGKVYNKIISIEIGIKSNFCYKFRRHF